MSDRLSQTLSHWKRHLFDVCAFVLFVVLLLRFFAHEIWIVISPFLR